MIDFIKVILTDVNISRLERELDFYDNINISTGEIRTVNALGKKITPFRKAVYKGLIFKIFENKLVTLSGSLHKYWNDGLHNYNDFNQEAINVVLGELKVKFNISPQQCVIKCLEIGINLTLPLQTSEIINYCFLHKTKPFEHKYNSNKGNYKQCVHQHYVVKIYDKAKQFKSKNYQIIDEIFRLEIKYKGIAKLKGKRISTLQDLLNYELSNFNADLLKEWDNILFYDNTTRINTLCKRDRGSIKNYSNPLYWVELLNNGQNENYKYHKKRFNKLIEKHSNNLKRLIRDEISLKVLELTNDKKNNTLNTQNIFINTSNHYRN
ncbi:hypothetical protein BWK59_00650 [Flavobacterium davisii]|uniref:Uncharacterized protein n=1 Tax=Flavobacterium davisii TaxID=2906077 RepID=A0A246GLL1_9FLAO|nr:hypothetical protein [Flavobacterium davisii]OWP85281.1 hypothetical protein BWK59_00650 [Flavobacterium davisii]